MSKQVMVVEHKVGETFPYGDVLLNVERTKCVACHGCYFHNNGCYEREIAKTGYCVKVLRQDYTFVIFKEVKHKTQ